VLYQQYGIDYRTQKRRVLTFMLDGAAALPPAALPVKFEAYPDPQYRADDASAKRGEHTFALYCAVCHGVAVVGGGHAPDLRASGVPVTAEAFKTIVQGGALVPNGMPRFEELSDAGLDDLRQYIRATARTAAPP
jgi:quinohemoprotein ethanol dehydrogenase